MIITLAFSPVINVSAYECEFDEVTFEIPNYCIEEKAEKVMPTATKFELNGKNINALNERFTVGKRDENFARKELEKERKEREKMFQ